MEIKTGIHTQPLHTWVLGGELGGVGEHLAGGCGDNPHKENNGKDQNAENLNRSHTRGCLPVGRQTTQTAASTAKFRDSHNTCSSHALCQGTKSNPMPSVQHSADKACYVTRSRQTEEGHIYKNLKQIIPTYREGRPWLLLRKTQRTPR